MSIQDTARAVLRRVPGTKRALLRARNFYDQWFQSHETQLRYLLNRSLLAAERERAESAPNVEQCDELEMGLDGFDARIASERLAKLGCLLVRGNGASRAAVLRYAKYLDASGYNNQGLPRGGSLWQFQHGDKFQFHMHRLVQEHFYELCRRHFGADVFLSPAGVSGSVRTVGPVKSNALIPFHQDISPGGMNRTFTFWIAIDPDRIGRVAPGLRLIASRRQRRHKKMMHDIDQRKVHETSRPGLGSDEFFWTPEINVGDVLIFDPYVCHASFLADGMTQPRTSVDLRVAPFHARQASWFLTRDMGLILFDRNRMVAPSRRSTEPPFFAYDGPADAEVLWRAFDGALQHASGNAG